MLPFITKLHSFKETGAKINQDSPLKFLNEWETTIGEEDLEMLTWPGEEDAFRLGKRMRKLYGGLLPPKRLGKGKGKKGDKVKVGDGLFSCNCCQS